MSAVSKSAIENAVVDTILASANFSTLAAAVIGFQYRVPLDYFPYCEVTITGEDEISEETGVLTRRYTGTIRFDVIIQDETVTLSSRKATITSYTTVSNYVNDCAVLFRRNVNRALNNLTGSGYAVSRFEILGGVEYGIDSRTERRDNYQNYGILPFMCEIRETKQA